MTRETTTGKLLALASKCEDKDETLGVAIDILEEVFSYFENRNCESCKDKNNTCNSQAELVTKLKKENLALRQDLVNANKTLYNISGVLSTIYNSSPS